MKSSVISQMLTRLMNTKTSLPFLKVTDTPENLSKCASSVSALLENSGGSFHQGDAQ